MNNQNNIFWGFKPQSGGAYCNINMSNVTINYKAPFDENAIIIMHQISGYKISEAIKGYSRLDKMVKETIDKFAKCHIDLFNKFINE